LYAATRQLCSTFSMSAVIGVAESKRNPVHINRHWSHNRLVVHSITMSSKSYVQPQT
jgi:hypothetical protein